MGTASEKMGFYTPDTCTLHRVVLRNPEREAELATRGYVVLPLLNGDEVASLTAGYDRISDELNGANEPGAYNDTYAEFSVIHSRPEFRRRAFELISGVLMPPVNRHVIDHRPLIANFVNKPPGTGVVPAHQNFSVVDETLYRSISVWVALVDCVLSNGAMSMLDGSHRTLRSRRGMWAYRAFSGIESSIIEDFLTPVEVPAGSAVILDDAVVHYSPPNLSAERRLAIQFVMVPEEADALWFQQVGTTGAGELDVVVRRVDERFFFDFWHGDGDVRFGPEIDRVTIQPQDLAVNDLRALLAEDRPTVTAVEERAAVGTEPTAPTPTTQRSSWWRMSERRPHAGLRARIGFQRSSRSVGPGRR